MTTQTEIVDLCTVALKEEDGWREGGAEGRKAAYERFQRLVVTIAELTGRPYEEVMNDAIEEWVKLHICSVADGEPSAEWATAGQENPGSPT